MEDTSKSLEHYEQAATPFSAFVYLELGARGLLDTPLAERVRERAPPTADDLLALLEDTTVGLDSAIDLLGVVYSEDPDAGMRVFYALMRLDSIDLKRLDKISDRLLANSCMSSEHLVELLASLGRRRVQLRLVC